MDEVFTCTDDMYCWPYDCVNVSYTVIFILFVCLWHVPCDSQGSMESIHVCMYVNDTICQNNIPWQAVLYTSPGQDPIEPYIVTDVRIHNPENINNWECITEKAHNCMVLLLHL